ncbi:TatD family hydrolase [Marinigracilibium pacificum]|uniref:Hydrolase TatD n=1 Tax=Marinigracilibium pacificum TaxID=2729599 RepID=A0A848JAX8_9BACT|nr:TatD family hydrolase [Marinigracilibium pacificum]NMM50192.1 hydrolase TatD [Marinigracilibium pacificum]
MNSFNIHSHDYPDQEYQNKVIYQVMAHEYDSLPDLPLVSVGIHPWYINEQDVEKQWLKVEEWANSPTVKAIGESGLDYNIETDKTVQEEIFIKHIELSEKLKKPLIIHCVKAHNELIRIRKKTKAKQQWIIHGVNQKLNSLIPLIERDIILSFGQAMLIEKSNARKIIRELGPGSYLFETDDSKNETINEIYSTASRILNKNIDQLTLEIKYLCEEIFDI